MCDVGFATTEVKGAGGVWELERPSPSYGERRWCQSLFPSLTLSEHRFGTVRAVPTLPM